MNSVLAGVIGIKCLVYLDDTIIYGKTLSAHNNKLIKVFKRLRINKRQKILDKCIFF